MLDQATASVIGLPRAGGRGLEWHYGRAGLPYSLASELSHTANRTTLASYTERLIDQRGRPPLAQSWLVGPALPALLRTVRIFGCQLSKREREKRETLP